MRHLNQAVATISLVMATTGAMAQEAAGCDSPEPTHRIAPCTALIEAPGTPAMRRAEAYFQRGLSYAQLGQHEREISDYDAAIRIAPWFAPALNNRADAYLKSGKPSQGVADIEKALDIAPNDPVYNATRGEIGQALGDRELAMRHHEAAMAFGGIFFVRLYQCSLKLARLYHGPLDGIVSLGLRTALRLCVDQGSHCASLPPSPISECPEPVV